jgi:hypothetical protein
MKKNILFVQSLLILSLAATSPLMGGRKNKKQRQAQRKAQQRRQLAAPVELTEEQLTAAKEEHYKRIDKVLQELMESEFYIKQNTVTPYHEIATNSLDAAVILDSETPKLVTSEIEIVNVSMPTCMAAKKEELNPEWSLQSVIIPTEKKELSWRETIRYWTRTKNQALQDIIYDLDTGAFDIKYGTSFDDLNTAIQTAISNNDEKSLMLIAALCQKKYPTSVRISGTVAQPAFELLKTHYTKELTLSKDALQKEREDLIKQWNMETAACITSISNAIGMYQQNVKNIHDRYNTTSEKTTQHVTDLRRDVSTFGILNPEIRSGIAELLTNNQLKTLNNIHAYSMAAAEKQLDSVAKKMERVPTIKELQKNPKYVERLTNK